MKPQKPANKNRQRELFRDELIQIIDPGHGLIKLANAFDWDQLDEVFGKTYCPENGRPAISTRLMVSLHYLNYTHNLSDDDIVTGWVKNPCWRFLSGMQLFESTMPIHLSSMSRWRKRVGDAEQLLKQTIEAGLKLKVIKAHQLKRINVGTMVQEKEVRFPYDASLGRVIRDIEGNCPEPNWNINHLLDISIRIYRQKRSDKNKIYSVHAPKVNCIRKGKAHKRYEFGCKVSVASTSKGGWFLAAMTLGKNPNDGHTLSDTLKQVERIVQKPEHVLMDMGCRGHGYQGDTTIHAGMNFAKLIRWAAGFLRLIHCQLFGILSSISISSQILSRPFPLLLFVET